MRPGRLQYIAISTDRTEDLPKWKRVIEKEAYPWKQMPDENGKISSKYGINTFPFNIVINSQGKIVGKNLTIKQILKL